MRTRSAPTRGIAFVLLGPTAGGKSRLAMHMAERYPVEIVSVDSAQVYRGMDIGTAKPTPAERLHVRHHLIDLIDPTESYSAGRFRIDAIGAIKDILSRERIPLLVGGTMLYYRSLAFGLDALPIADPEVRAQINAEAALRGWPALHEALARADPDTARRLSPNDAQRIQRALEVLRLTGRPLSSLQTANAGGSGFQLRTFALLPHERADLHRRIAERFDAMLAAGFVEELESLRRRFRLSADLPSMRCVGYRQVWQHLEGAYDRVTLREKAVAATRQLAKRQITWLRSFREAEPLPPEDAAPRLAEALHAAFTE
jgi:tRNA dimethylallyltransferase